MALGLAAVPNCSSPGSLQWVEKDGESRDAKVTCCAVQRQGSRVIVGQNSSANASEASLP